MKLASSSSVARPMCCVAVCTTVKYSLKLNYAINRNSFSYSAPLIRSRPWRLINLLTYLLTYFSLTISAHYEQSQ